MNDVPLAPKTGYLWVWRVLCWLLVALGSFNLIAGFLLARLGGSFFYLIFGATLLISSFLLLRRRLLGQAIYLCLLIATAIWTIWESQGAFWYIFPRIFIPLLFGVVLFALAPLHIPRTKDRMSYALAILFASISAYLFVNLFINHGLLGPAQQTQAELSKITNEQSGAWDQYAGSLERRSAVPYTQINKGNVGNLKVAWTFHTGEIHTDGGLIIGEDQNTPLQIDDTVFLCTPLDKVFALDADTGKQKWLYNAKGNSPLWQRCRSLAYADISHDTFHPISTVQQRGSDCAQRLFLGTIDARLIALDAATGKLCRDFGQSGTVDLTHGMGDVAPGMYMQTSGPTVIENGLVVIAGWIMDNHSVNEPSGVVRAFDARTGGLVWAWDLANPQSTGEPPAGQTYTRGTPNVWAFPSVDEKLKMIYLPLGNATPDYWGGYRTKTDDAYNSSVVALDYRTGREQWKFQTVHHDIWDYDVPTHPVLYDQPDGKGGTVPALLQATKRGEIFMLDRRNGHPLAKVEEKPVPTHDVAAGDYVSPTQPYSVDMPQIRAPRLTERDMWGMTSIDQLMCRIRFRMLRYDGDFTPQSVKGIIQYPGNLGGMNWGGMSLDTENNLLIVNDIRIAMEPHLIPRSESDKFKAGDGHLGYSPALGTPFGVTTNYFLSPLGVPCIAPPFGTLSAVDLSTKKIRWQVPLGTSYDSGPLGIKTRLPMTIGLPTLGGALTTAGGIVFYSGTQDYYLRAFDVHTGRELWKGRLPVGSQATPMSYISPKTHRQYIVLTASGARGQPDRGDYVIAYSLNSEDDTP
ncbi:membrane-bound PQQ-dependent dehydrogenase, glucose/quinate/shikimate family [Pseudomonas aeruginosa]|jgi:quinate dehydrogenase (quinone)|uniref:membrane-bound PQQ-dependent dehydrogenase, glucose/quinate/shikimate family n=1 Tax=Pseudomonas aeruginosa TaxID=287 RepID=UPI000BA0F708|nr:membrane-bound PQQ-dependent dehydrogenase, glucose/quinate/shikimate family [Pseudomonas aeruginosa]EIU1321617.1 membrane-bound PQQ-dependent dehydrogenase, glucose/quinate/shikimate family [Pseudomonas aeruginosa]ELY3880513.1 membrane-bound PQQ-dependent dehydrogenase, glucose/quinate/shikimate family [Pseudomonas aeruginosa]MCO2110197.1 membrane-bound PQQ-dependent dehydrogenase, glucose/quinate/shikimate family [Pseudomonas aeruginosa]MDV8060208.1 membrane-bound PQQ-dependent dehydrogena